MISNDNQLLGLGIYTVAEASRLTGVSAHRIARWIRGYVYRHQEIARASPAIWKPELPEIDGNLSLSFHDLMEVRFIDAFRTAGVQWRTIRAAAQAARQLFDRDHPFSAQGFSTDGRSIFAKVVRETSEPALLDLVKSQFAFERVIKRSLYSGFEFNGAGEVARWWPTGKSRRIVLDPQVSFGQPVESKSAIPTATLSQAFRVEGSLEAVAHWYAVDIAGVRQAISYEKRLAA